MSAVKRVYSGRTVKDAINKGLQELGVKEDDVKVTVLEEPSRGFFGLFGAKDARVELEVIVRDEPPEPTAQVAAKAEDDGAADDAVHAETAEPPPSDVLELAKAYLADIAEKMGVKASVASSALEDGYILFEMKGKNLGLLIGRRGQTLDALQTLVNVYANRLSGEHLRIILDAERFRERRKKTLEDLSMRLANQVVRTKKEVVLEPMSAHERRIIHFKLQNHPKVKTYSKGEEPNRRIVITLK